MTSPGSRPQRRGFLANLSSALTPAPIEEDDTSKPLVVPTGIKAAMVLSLIGGLIYLFVGTATVVLHNQQIDSYRVAYASEVAKCEAVGGIGDAVTTTPAPDQAELATTCKGYRTMQAQDWSGLTTQLVLFGLLFAAMGAASIAAGWFIRTGALWARRVLIGVVAVAFILTLLFAVSGWPTMLATLLLAVALMLSFIGKGGIYIARTKARRKAA